MITPNQLTTAIRTYLQTRIRHNNNGTMYTIGQYAKNTCPRQALHVFILCLTQNNDKARDELQVTL
jgi:hypothetical protein